MALSQHEPARSTVPDYEGATSGATSGAPDVHPRTIQLNHALNFCRHGHEVRQLTVEEVLGHWIVWGHYACAHCSRVALDAYSHEPAEAEIAGRRLPILTR